MRWTSAAPSRPCCARRGLVEPDMPKRVAGYAVAVVAVSIVASCATGNEKPTMPQNRDQTSMMSSEDLAAVSPAMERYRREALQASLWTRPQLSLRDRSIVTIAALIARNQTAEQAHYLGVALDNGVRPSEISEIITHLAFYAGWGTGNGDRPDRARRVRGAWHLPRGVPAASATLLPSIRAEAQNARPWWKRPWALWRRGSWSTSRDVCQDRVLPPGARGSRPQPRDRQRADRSGPGRAGALSPHPRWTAV